jgi:hypothetical protein
MKKSLAAILLVIFAFSLIPKKFLHHTFANHKDSKSATSSDAFHKKISTSTINCLCDDLVVEAPYLSYSNHFKFFGSVVFPIQLPQINNSFISSFQISFCLRGPPALV